MDIENSLVDSSRALADMVADAIVAEPALFTELLKIAQTRSYPLSMRAARVADICSEKYPDIGLPYIEDIVDIIFETKNESIRRNFLRIITRHHNSLGEEKTGRLMDACFNWLTSVKTTIGIKAYCIEILYGISQQYPELKSELGAILQSQFPYLSAGLKVRAKKYLKKINNEMLL